MNISRKKVFMTVSITALIAASVFLYIKQDYTTKLDENAENLESIPSEIQEKQASLSGEHDSRMNDETIGEKNSQTADAVQQDQIITETDSDRDLRLAGEVGFGQPTSIDVSSPLPSDDNVMAKPTGEFAEQIDQNAIYAQAESEGLISKGSDSKALPPSEENIAAKAKGEFSPEIEQQAIVQKAQLEGYALPEVAPDSHPPTETNISSTPDGDYADEINPAQ